MRRDKQIDFQKAFNYIGPLNYSQTVYFATQNKQQDARKFIVKRIFLGTNFNQVKPVIDATLRKLYQSTQSNIIKPQFYALQDGYLYIAQKPYNMSLQNLIIAHKKEKVSISPDLVWTFTCKIYDTINRMKQTQFYHQNLKPSNIFLEYGQNQTRWLISQTGLLTNFKNKFYSKGFTNVSRQQSSLKADPLENQFYSLGIMIFQLMTLAPIDKIDEAVRDRSFQKIYGLQQSSKTYGPTLIQLAKQLLNPKDNLKEYFTKYRQEPPRRSNQTIYLDDYYRQWSYLQEFTKQDIPQKVYKDIKQVASRKQLTCDKFLQIAEIDDPDFNFTFQGIKQCQNFLSNFGVKLSIHHLLNFCHFFLSNSQFRYMDLIQKILPLGDIVKSIIAKAIHISAQDKHKQFFQTQTQGRAQWKTQEIRNFLATLGINVDLKQLQAVVKEWTHDKAQDAIKYRQFHIAFKGATESILSVNKSLLKQSSDPNKQVELKQMLEEVKQKVPNKNLVSFFRLHDHRQKWVVTSQIEKQLKKYVTLSDSIFKNVCQQMWKIAGVKGQTQTSKVLRYIQLLKLTKVYQLTELFRLVLSQKINETNRSKLFETYCKQEKGWTQLSFIDFNYTENLDFDERQLKMIFNQLDRDNNKYLSQGQLVYKLTGLRQFDQQFIITQIKQMKRNKGYDLFKAFVTVDIDKDLFLNNPAQIKQFFEYIGMDVPINHCQILFNKFQRSKKFQYITFLRFFEEVDQLFLKSCLFVIDKYYNNNFDKFFDVGLKNHNKKWKRDSISFVNDQLVLGFTQNQIGQIWEKMDQGKDGSLTKQQVAKIFGFSVDNQNQLPINPLSSTLLTTQKRMDSMNQSKQQLRNQDQLPISSGKKLFYNQTMEEQIKQQIQKSAFLKDLKQKNSISTAKIFYRQSEGLGWMEYDKFISTCINIGIKANKISIINAIKKYVCTQENERVQKVNYIKLLMFINESSQNPSQAKAAVLQELLKLSIADKKLRTDQIFQKCRKQGQMKLRDLQRIMEQILDVDLYSDDLECLWKVWGNQDYLTPQDFDLALHGKIRGKYNQQNSPPTRINKEYSFQDKANTNRYSKDSQQKSQKQIVKTDVKNYARVQEKKLTFKPTSTGRQQQRKQQFNKLSARQEDKSQQVNQRNSFLDNLLSKKAEQSNKNRPSQSENKNNINNQRDQSQNKKHNLSVPPRPSISQQVQKSNLKIMSVLQQKLKEKGDGPLNDLFAKETSIQNKKFVRFLIESYGLDEDQAYNVTGLLSSYGRVKVENVKKYIKKAYNSQQLPQKRGTVPQAKDKKNYEYKRQDNSSPQKESNLPNTTGKKLVDPRKTKMNIPLIKQHIKILISNFCKRFDISQLQPYFFDGGQSLGRQQFKMKCQSINNSISDNVFDKIFDYMKPKGQRINNIGFRIAFSFDEGIQIEQNYLPQQIEREIRQIFDASDKDKSGTIQLPQIEKLLQSMGLNETQKQIQSYFIRIDQNFDKKVDFKQFKLFIEQNILPQISTFDQQIDQLRNLLQMNDLYNIKSLSINTLVAVLEKYGVKLDQQQANNLVKALGNQNQQIGISNFLKVLEYPNQPAFSTRVKSVLYKIKWKKKIAMRDVRKVFQNISSSFLISYTSDLLKKHYLKYSTCHTPVLHDSGFYYLDFQYKDIRNISKIEANLIQQLNPSDLVVQVKLMEAYGLPIPQNNLKNQIARRYVNITFYDSSAQTAKYTMCTIQVQWDQDIQDQWLFDKTNRSIFIKINQYDHKKYQRVLILFQFIITVIQDGRPYEISCGSANIPVRELFGIDGRVSKKAKIISGLPNKARDIDKMAISKRSGWRGLIQGKDQQSQLQLQISSPNKFSDKISFLASMPRFTIINRKIVHFVWAFRQYFALKSFSGGVRANPDFVNNFKVKVFQLCFDIPTIYQQIVKLWKDKIQYYTKNDAKKSRQVINLFFEQTYQVINCKQFDYHPSKMDHSVLHNRNLHNLRIRMIEQVFENIHQWIRYTPDQAYRRNKPYSNDFKPFKIQETQLRPEDLNVYKTLVKFYRK